ncbi:hypothetical protein HMPREF0083_04663 [Aneurinibacillus aneurinilyticus ATCC 12856]|uniref:Uncharacterized protein n=1 Tax=Aneurinibacillus aneurinilyticus ATCC 12856 TaxID=649747 RepID=U1Y8X1_ANEAE|nr:hypothetical protein HMPREF0083_04663 [Aneurinibacillus aneurinilyticus ATCC 12856]
MGRSRRIIHNPISYLAWQPTDSLWNRPVFGVLFFYRGGTAAVEYIRNRSEEPG